MTNHVNVTGFHHIAIDVKDFDKSIEFYTKVMGFTLYRMWGEGPTRGCLLDTGNSNYLELFAATPADNRPEGYWKHLALKCTDTATAIARVKAAGYQVTMESKDISLPALPVRIAFFKGPDGELIEFFQTL